MAFHDLLNHAGGLGRFQILHIIFLCICNVTIIPHNLLENFTAAIPGHRCWVHILDSDTVTDNNTGTLGQEALLRISIPLDSNQRPEKCRRFIQPQWQLLHPNATFSNSSEPDTEPCVDGWVYDRSSFLSTTVTEWDLVCESQSLSAIAKFSFLSGILVSNILCGHLTDRFGRKSVFIYALVQMAIVETCEAFAPTFLIYCFLRFLGGVSMSSLFMNSGLFLIEWTTPKFQATVMTLMLIAGSIGHVILGALAFAIRNWHTLQLVSSVPLFFLLIPARWLGESPRWMIITNKPQKGLKELRRAARVNGIKNGEDILTMEVVRNTMKQELEAAQTQTSMRDLFRTPVLRKRIFILSLLRFIIRIPLIGFTFHLQHLGSNVFLLQGLYGAISIPANFCANFLLNHIGRRISQVLFMFLLGISILAIIFVPHEMQALLTVVATFGGTLTQMCMAGTFVHANELLPTIVRATALGFIGIAGGIGAAISPLFMILKTYSESLPWIIYGVLSILSSLVVLLLPETMNQPLPDSIQQIENEGKGSQQLKQEDAFIKVTQF